MGLFGLFGKKETQAPAKAETPAEREDTHAYSGMRVEVLSETGEMLFVAKLQRLNGGKGELQLYSEYETGPEFEPIRATIRGYSDRERKAVHMQGLIAPGERHVWQVEELSVVKVGNDRAFFRLDTNIDAEVTMFSGLERGERHCRLLNVSVGGACIGTDARYHAGDKFLLKFQLIDDRPVSAMYCQIVRVSEKPNGKFEYGCRFLELTEDDQQAIIQNIFAVQRQKRGRS